MAPEKTVVGILTEARGYVSQGWMQGRRTNRRRDRFCAVGAINKAAYGDPRAYGDHPGQFGLLILTNTAKEELARAAGLADRFELDFWNDRGFRTQADVLLTFDATISRCSVPA